MSLDKKIQLVRTVFWTRIVLQCLSFMGIAITICLSFKWHNYYTFGALVIGLILLGLCMKWTSLNKVVRRDLRAFKRQRELIK